MLAWFITRKLAPLADRGNEVLLHGTTHSVVGRENTANPPGNKLKCGLAVIAMALGSFVPQVSGQSATAISVPYRVSATGAGNSYAPAFSADGRSVTFVSHANNLVTNDDLGPHLDLFVRDLAASNTVLVSVSTNGIGGA